MSEFVLDDDLMTLRALEGCSPALLQDLFQRVARHLLTQKAKARLLQGGCRYLDDAGRRCAVGCLIRPGEYDASIEGYDSDSDAVHRVLERSGVPVAHRAVRDLLGVLRRLHDHAEVEDWPYFLGRVATLNGFEMPCPKN